LFYFWVFFKKYHQFYLIQSLPYYLLPLILEVKNNGGRRSTLEVEYTLVGSTTITNTSSVITKYVFAELSDSLSLSFFFLEEENTQTKTTKRLTTTTTTHTKHQHSLVATTEKRRKEKRKETTKRTFICFVY